MQSSPFGIWLDWLNKIRADMLANISSAAIRHAKMSGSASSHTLFWFRTGEQGTASGCFASMEHGGDAHSTLNLSELISFLRQLPTNVRAEIIKGIDL